MATVPHIPKEWQIDLESMGFEASSDAVCYRHSDYLFEINGPWARLCVDEPHGRSNNRAELGRAGPWKTCTSVATAKVHRVFEMPLSLPGSNGRVRQESDGHLREYVEWALQTRGGASPRSWTLPSRHIVDALITPQALTIESDSAVRQASVAYEPERFAIHAPVLHTIPEELSPARRAWLEALRSYAHNSWRLVRVGCDGCSSMRAEVDLSGIPDSVVEHLVPIALDALRTVVKWILHPAELLADVRCECRAVEEFTPPLNRVFETLDNQRGE